MSEPRMFITYIDRYTSMRELRTNIMPWENKTENGHYLLTIEAGPVHTEWTPKPTQSKEPGAQEECGVYQQNQDVVFIYSEAGEGYGRATVSFSQSQTTTILDKRASVVYNEYWPEIRPIDHVEWCSTDTNINDFPFGGPARGRTYYLRDIAQFGHALNRSTSRKEVVFKRKQEHTIETVLFDMVPAPNDRNYIKEKIMAFVCPNGEVPMPWFKEHALIAYVGDKHGNIWQVDPRSLPGMTTF